MTWANPWGPVGNMTEDGTDDKIEDWIDTFQHDENKTQEEVETRKNTKFRYSFLTYLKLLSELHTKTALSEEEGREDILFPPSHSLTQTDREYFNIVRTEDGQSMFAREQDRGREDNRRRDREREDKISKERGRRKK